MPYHQALVSIITPTYNRAEYLCETIESVLGQSYPNIEYIVLDDGSNDSTREVLLQYQGKIHWLSHANVGEAETINRGWRMAKGDYICVVNSDDPVLPDLAENSVRVLTERRDLLVVYPDWVMIDHASTPVKVVRSPDYDYLKMLRWQECIVGPGAFIRRRALELEPSRDVSYKYVGDFEYWLRLGMHGPFARIPLPLATHRVHPASLSASGSLTGAQEYLRLVQEYFARPGISLSAVRAQREAYSNAAYLAGRYCMRLALPAARSYFLESVRHYPLGYLRRRPIRFIMVLASFLPERLSQVVRSRLEQLARSPRRHFEGS